MTIPLKKLIRLTVIYLFLIGAGLLYLLMLHGGKGIPCFFYYNFHIQCPGCGSTRALESLLSGDLLSAIHYHPIYTLFLYPFTFLLIAQDYIICLINVIKQKNLQSFAGFLWAVLSGEHRRSV